jgi:peptidoglycan/xylan/chitin deacetylase (PgdA/CDA1 family)
LRRRHALTVLLVLVVAGCASPEPRTGGIPLAEPSPTPGPALPVATPSAAPVPSATPAPATKPPATRQPPPVVEKTGPAPLNCTGTATIDRPPATGSGPLGSRTTTGSNAVALTFDDGPDPINTPRILDLLKQCGVHATFCVNGVKVQLYPDVIRRIHAEGHALCNHTWRHIRQLGTYGQPRITQDLTDTNNAIHAIVPDAAISYFRAPSGTWSDDYLAVCAAMSMTPIHWDVDPSDWQSEVWGTGASMVNHIVEVVQGNVRPGSIVLSHDYQKPDTTAAYRILLPWLKARFTLIALPPGGIVTTTAMGPAQPAN